VLGLGMSVVPTVDVGTQPTGQAAKVDKPGDGENAQ
jgi:hypothetical protein